MQLKPRHLIQLAAIDEHGSYVRAAEALHISQPALSISVRRIEDIAKAKLVVRGRSGARLTPVGKILARRGREIELAVSSAVGEVDLVARGISGRLRVGGSPLATNGIIPDIVGGVLKILPDVFINVSEGVDVDLLNRLRDNELDVIICAPGSAVNRAPFVTQRLFSAPTRVIVRPGHRLASRRYISLADLDAEIWALPPNGGAFRKQVEALFTTNGIPFPERVVEAASLHTLARIVRNSDAVTVGSEQIVADPVEFGELKSIRLRDAVADRTFGIHRHREREMDHVGKLFLDLALEMGPKFDV